MSEGYVVRTVEGFAFDEFASHIAKWVRKGHVQTDEHWKANWRNDPNFVNALGTKFEVGCWIETCHGPAVCTSYDPTKGVSYRYEAQRPGEDESIWVANGDVLSLVTYLRPADEQSRWVLTLRGPYGEGGST